MQIKKILESESYLQQLEETRSDPLEIYRLLNFYRGVDFGFDDGHQYTADDLINIAQTNLDFYNETSNGFDQDLPLEYLAKAEFNLLVAMIINFCGEGLQHEFPEEQRRRLRIPMTDIDNLEELMK